MNSKAYKEYYAIATGEAAPKPKASVRRTRSSSDTSITPSTTAASPRLTASTKGKQTAKASKAKSLSALSEVAMTEAQQLKLVTKRSMQQTHISQPSGSGTDEGTGDDNEEKDDDSDEEDEGDDGEEGNNDDVEQEVDRDDDKDDDEEEGDGEEDQGLNIDEEERHVEEEEEDELYRDVNINQGRGIQANIEVEDSHVTLTLVNPDGQQQSSSVSSQFVTRAVSAIPEIIHQYMEQRMNEAVKVAVQIQSDRLRDEAQRENAEFLRTVDENIKKIIKEQVKEQVKAQVSKILLKIEHAVNEQLEAEVLIRSSHSSRTFYAVDDEEPSAGPDRGSKRRGEGKEPKSASAPTKTATRSVGRSTQGSRSRQVPERESALAEEPMLTTSQTEEPSHPEFDIGADDQPIVDTLTPKLLAGPTYELMKGSCKSLVELEYHLEEVFKATTDQLDWFNPEGQQYPHNLLQPLPLIPNNQGRRVIPFEHFINNDLEYLHGGKLTNLTVEERFAFNVSLRMFTRSIVIQRRVEDLQLGVESYQKKLNLTKPDSYRSDLKRKEAYTTYSNLRGFIYQNKDKRNRLIRIDELHKFSDRMLTDVRTALDDCLKGIRMQYLPQSIWRKNTYGETVTLKRGRDDDADKDEEPSAGPDRGSKRHREGKEHESASAPIETATRSADDQPIVQSSQHPEWFPKQQIPPTPDCYWNKTLPAVHGSIQPWISELAKQADSRSSFNELMDTPLDFSNFLMNRLRVDTLTPELLAGPTYELMKGSCKSLIELEYHLEEVYKATTDQLNWVNPKAQQYPHNLLQPLPLIPNNRGRRVITFENFINNDLEYLRGGAC
nr:hypothetical protein [Tanacetum cinerariifolium]